MQESVLDGYQKSSSLFDQVGRKFLMQDRHERDRTESVMLGPAFQTSCVMEKLQDKSRTLQDPDIFAFDTAPCRTSSTAFDCFKPLCSFNLFYRKKKLMFHCELVMQRVEHMTICLATPARHWIF